MSQFLHISFVFLVVCLICTCHGRQAQTTYAREPSTDIAGRLRARSEVDAWSASNLDQSKVQASNEYRFQPSSALASLLLIITALPAFNPSGSGVGASWSHCAITCLRSAASAGQTRLGCKFPLMGRESEIEALQKKFEFTKLYHGLEHPDTLRALSDYAVRLSAIGRKTEAEPLSKDVLDLRRRVLGPDNHETIMALNHYADMLSQLGRENETAPLREEVLRLTRNLQGPKHSDTLYALQTYTATLVSLGQDAAAAPLINETLELAREFLGTDLLIYRHSLLGNLRQRDTLKALRQYANTFNQLGLHAESRDLYKDILQITRQVSGSTHPDMFNALNKYAVTLARLGQEAEAEPLWKELRELIQMANGPKLLKGVLDLRRSALGADHPETLWAMATYADTLTEMGRFAKAEPVNKEVLELRRRVLGPEHPNTLRALHSYAETLGTLAMMRGLDTVNIRLKDLQEMIPDFEEDAQEQEETFQGRKADGIVEQLFLEVQELRDEVLGSDDSDVSN